MPALKYAQSIYIWGRPKFHILQGISTQFCRKMEMFLSIGSHDTQDHNSDWMNNPEGTLDINYFTRLWSFWQFKNVKFFPSENILTVIPEVRFKFFRCGGLSLFFYVQFFSFIIRNFLRLYFLCPYFFIKYKPTNN